METLQFDTAKAEAFTYKLVNVLNSGALTLLTSLGHRSGLFDAMCKLPPSTSEEIAQAAGLNERYVREWLGGMVAGGFVEIDPDGPRYYLPAEHAANLTRDAGADNIAVYAQYIPELGSVESRILECFRNGGGVAYEEFHRFHEVMAEDSGQTVLSSLMDSILPLVPGLSERLKAGIEVLDVGCGRGRALNLMARAFPHSRFTGVDLSLEAIRFARGEAKEHGTANVEFRALDLTDYDWPAQFDLITTFDAVHDQARPDKVLAGIFRSLRPDGVYLMQDIAASCHHHKNLEHPLGPMLYTVSTMHCMTVSLAQGGLGLGSMWGEETAKSMLRDAGFTSIEVKKLPHDVQNNYYIVRK